MIQHQTSNVFYMFFYVDENRHVCFSLLRVSFACRICGPFAPLEAQRKFETDFEGKIIYGHPFLFLFLFF